MKKPEFIQLPDYLPTRFNPWLEFYQFIVEDFTRLGIKVNDQTEIKLGEFMRQQELNQFDLDAETSIMFYQEFKLWQIKARAFDYLYSNLPDKSAIGNFRDMCIPMSHKQHEFIKELFKIAKS